MNSFTDCSAFCPGAPKRVPSKLSKNGMRAYTLSDRRSKKLRVYTASEAKGLRGTQSIPQGHPVSTSGTPMQAPSGSAQKFPHLFYLKGVPVTKELGAQANSCIMSGAQVSLQIGSQSSN